MCFYAVALLCSADFEDRSLVIWSFVLRDILEIVCRVGAELALLVYVLGGSATMYSCRVSCSSLYLCTSHIARISPSEWLVTLP